ncbi:hypothetical protein OHA70_19155 [Kribbella sp. NBC_00382]|uniref:hypothetical protein n=1 Tax=Kribbella sp. NBC_00382 TaxID=2975967 RepID=UPI002E239B4D
MHDDVPLLVVVAILASIPGATYAGLNRDEVADWLFVLVAMAIIVVGIGVTDNVRVLTWVGSIGLFFASSVAVVQIRRRRASAGKSSP